MNLVKNSLVLLTMGFVIFTSLPSHAKRPLLRDQFQAKLAAQAPTLAPAFYEYWQEMMDHQNEYKVNLDKKNQDPNNCLKIQKRPLRKEGSAARTNEKQFVFITNKTCLENPRTEWSEHLHDQISSFWFYYMKNDLKSKLVSLVYKNNFFHFSEYYNMNIETDLHSMMGQFFTIASRVYIRDRVRFEKKHPAVAELVQKVIFNKIKDPNLVNLNFTEDHYKPLFARVKMISESNDAWFIRYNMIKKAKKSIRLQSYSLFDDLYGRALVGLLLEAMERGVDVKVSLDGRGSILTSRSDLVELLVQRGASVSSYNPLLWSSLNLNKFFFAGPLDGIMSSNHDKILVVDDRKILTGGRNIGNRYFVMEGEDKGKIYQDMDVYAECEDFPLSTVLAFNIEFYSANAINVNSIFTRQKKYKQIFSALRTLEAKMLGRSLSGADFAMYPEIAKIKSIEDYKNFDASPSEELYEISGLDKTSSLIDNNALTDELFDSIDNAQEKITIINPYVILSSRMKQKLVNAGQRGVKITIVTTSPTSTDSKLTQARLIGEWRSLLTDIPNLRLFGAKGPIKLHAKSFVFDSKISFIGSYNLDLLSETVNSEFALKVISEEFGQDLEEFIEDYAFNKSLEYDVEKNIGPHSQEGGKKKFRSMNRLRFLSGLIRAFL